MSRNTEIEERTNLDAEQVVAIDAFMTHAGEPRQFGRVMIELSGVERDHTAKIRINDGVVEIVAKSGDLAANGRHEAEVGPTSELNEAIKFLDITGKTAEPAEVITASVSLLAALGFMARLGYTEAKVCIRDVAEVDAEGLNVSMRRVISTVDGEVKDTLLEVEAIDPDWDDEMAHQKVNDFFVVHNLTPFTKEQWKDWVRLIHETVDFDFVYTQSSAQELANRLVATGMLRPELAGTDNLDS